MRLCAALLISIFLGAFGGASTSWARNKSSCRLPVADNQDASPPNFKGTVVSIDMGKRTLKVAAAEGKSEVLVTKISEQNIFTNFGGIVRFDEIKVGDTVRVWSKNCSSPIKGKLAVTAMIVDR